MNQKICDLCKKPLNECRIINHATYIKNYYVVIKKHILERIVGGFRTGYEKLDICNDCMDKIVDYISKTKET